jgi:hypothetical protein
VGPITSGGYFLALQRGVHPIDHPLDASYVPLHKGGVDRSTGLYEREDDDLVLKATPPFVLRRTYRTNDRRSLEFGVGASHNGEWYLYGDGAHLERTFVHERDVPALGVPDRVLRLAHRLGRLAVGASGA